MYNMIYVVKNCLVRSQKQLGLVGGLPEFNAIDAFERLAHLLLQYIFVPDSAQAFSYL